MSLNKIEISEQLISTSRLICRACLTSDMEKGISIYDQILESSISQHLNLITGISVREDDGLPDIICPKCVLDLESAVSFRKRCEHADSFLRSSTDLVMPEPLEEIKKEKIELSDEDFDYESFPIISDIKLEEVVPAKHRSKYYECCYCSKKFRKKTLLSTHIRIDHPAFTCKFCSKTYKLKTSYHNHLNKCRLKVDFTKDSNYKPSLIDLSENPDYVECSKCKKQFKETYIKNHMNLVHSNKILQCDYCNKMYKEMSRLLQHKEKCKLSDTTLPIKVEGIGQDRKFICTLCGLIICKYHKIIRHVSLHSDVKSFVCNVCPKSFKLKEHLKKHLVSHDAQNTLPCDKCGKIYTFNQLKVHLKVVHGERKFQCDNCDKNFTTKTNLLYHIKTCHQPKSFKCSKCLKSFSLPFQLKEHVHKFHNTTRFVYKCPYGEACFRNRKALTIHTKIASPGSHFCCRVPCNKTFTEKNLYEEHQKTHETDFKCPYCVYSYPEKKGFWAHMRRKHKNKIKAENLHEQFSIKKVKDREFGAYKCPYCTELFSRPYSVRRHIEFKHPGKEKKVINLSNMQEKSFMDLSAAF